MTLRRKAFRSVRKNLSFYLVTCFLTMVAVTMLVGALTTANTLGLNSEEIYGNLYVEDAQFVTGQKISDEDLLRYEDDFDLYNKSLLTTGMQWPHRKAASVC